ncbi:MAG: ABC transporter permease [Anaerolineales bacterium]|nr:ABC transporter permease [Anaerolineales bacterium]
MAVTTAPAVPQLRPLKRASSATQAWRRFTRNKAAVAALIIIVLQVLMAVFAKYLSPYDPYYSDFSATYQKPNAQHWFGTDDLGRDVFSRIIYGTRVSYAVGVISNVVIVLIGLPIGAISGLVGGWLDYVVMRVIDVLSSIPGLLLYILLLIALGAGVGNIILAMSITGWIGIARLVRGQVLSLKESDFVRASRSMGGNTSWIVRTHILRNSLTPVIVSMTLGVPGAMFGEAGLSFLGLGVPPPTPSWGQMIGIYQSYVRTAPHLIVVPSIVLAFTMLVWVILGDGVRDALDPNIRS